MLPDNEFLFFSWLMTMYVVVPTYSTCYFFLHSVFSHKRHTKVEILQVLVSYHYLQSFHQWMDKPPNPHTHTPLTISNPISLEDLTTFTRHITRPIIYILYVSIK